MRSVSLILAPADDVHALSVAAEIERAGGRPLVVDTATFPAETRLTFSLDQEGPPRFRLERGSALVTHGTLAGLWSRRPRAFGIPERVRERRVRDYCAREARSAFEGWLSSLGDLVINAPAAEHAADSKVHQLAMARQVGIAVPRTRITNSPTEVRAFYDELEGNVVFKVLTPPSWQVAETRVLCRADLDVATALDAAPSIFQELVSDATDIRATVVDDECFAAEIVALHPGAAVDWRLDIAPEIRGHPLPDDVRARLVEYMRALGLRYGAIDLMRTRDGEYVFLEVNPAGQFLFVEIETGQPICAAIARALSRDA